MAFAVAQPASFADPVIVLLPDGSIRLYHEQLMQVRDVLKEFPHHGLASLNHTAREPLATSRRSQPPNAAPLPPERFLRPGGTYCLLEHPVSAAHDTRSTNHARPHDLATCAAECTAGDAENRIDDSESPSGDATVVSCFTPRASRASTRQRAAVAAKGGGFGLERAASMPPINHSLRAALMMPTTPRKPTTGAASGAVALPPSPSAAAAAALPATSLPPLARTTSGTVPSTAPTIPNSVSQRARPSSAASALISPRAPPASTSALISPHAPPSSASALISPRAPPSSSSALISPRAPPASASSLVSPRALLSSGSRKLARALTALPRPRKNASRERDGAERSRVPRDVSNHGAAGPWSLMDLVSPKGAASASHAENHTAAQLGAYAISAEDMYSWEKAIRDLKISRGERDDEGEAECGERQRNGGVRYAGGRNEARQTNWSGGLTPRGLPLLSPVETTSESGEGTQQQGLNAADSMQSTQGRVSRVSSQGSLGMARSSSESSESSCTGGGGSNWRASRTSVAGSSSGSVNANTSDSSSFSGSVSSSSKGRLQAASHRLSLFKSLRLHVARPSAAAVLGVNTAEKAAAVEGTHADGVSRNTPSLTNGGLSPGAAKLACAAGPGEGGSEETSLGDSAPGVAASSDSSSNDLTQMKDWFSRNVASAPNTPLPVLPREAPTPKLVNNPGFVAAASGSSPAGPIMRRMHGVNASDYVVQPFPVTPLHAIS